MEIIAGILMVIIAVALIGVPFMEKEVDENGIIENSGTLTLGQRKEILMTTLGEIEFDYKMNKLTKEDYQELKSLYKEKAVNVMKREDQIKGISQEALIQKVEDELEAELKALENKNE